MHRERKTESVCVREVAQRRGGGGTKRKSVRGGAYRETTKRENERETNVESYEIEFCETIS